eukprot:1147972-Pelagomonas_calceolata.AAC.7
MVYITKKHGMHTRTGGLPAGRLRSLECVGLHQRAAPATLPLPAPRQHDGPGSSEWRSCAACVAARPDWIFVAGVASNGATVSMLARKMEDLGARTSHGIAQPCTSACNRTMGQCASCDGVGLPCSVAC